MLELKSTTGQSISFSNCEYARIYYSLILKSRVKWEKIEIRVRGSEGETCELFNFKPKEIVVNRESLDLLPVEKESIKNQFSVQFTKVNSSFKQEDVCDRVSVEISVSQGKVNKRVTTYLGRSQNLIGDVSEFSICVL